MFPFLYYNIDVVGVQSDMGGTILHFTTELGRDTVGGVGTFVNELRRVSGPRVRFAHLVPAERSPFAPRAGISGTIEPDAVADGVGAIMHGSRPTDDAKASAAARARNDDETLDEARTIRAAFYDMDILNALTFDVAVFHHYALAYLVSPSFLRGRPLVFVVHSVPTTEPWSLLDPYGGNGAIARSFEKLCDAADAIVCVSDAERGKLLTLYPDLEAKTSAIANGFSAFGAPGRDLPPVVRGVRRTFGFLGRPDYRKGLRELVRDMAEIDGSLRIGCDLGDASATEYVRAVRDAADARGASPKLRWDGRIGETDKLAFLRSLDALIVPSRWEPFGYVALEAIRAGITPLISRRGGMPEIVGPGYPYTFDPYVPGDIGACVRRFQADDAAAVRAALAQARRHAERLTAESTAAAYDALAEALTASAASATGGDGATTNKRRYGGKGPYLSPSYANASATPMRNE